MASSSRIDLKRDIIALSRLQVELRQKLQTYLSDTNVSINTVARESGIKWGNLSRFIKGEQALMAGEGLRGLATLLGAKQLGREMAELGGRIADLYSGLVAFDEKVITIAFDLLIAFESQTGYTMAEFADVFTANETVVLGALKRSKDALEVLRDQPEVVNEVVDQLLDDQFDTKLKRAKESLAQRRLVKVEEVERLVATLLPYCDDKTTLVHSLGLPRGSFDRVALTRASDTQLDMFIAKLTEAIKSAKAADEELEKFRMLYEQLRDWLGSQKEVALALGVATSTLSDAFNGKSGKDTVSRLLATASELASRPQSPPTPASAEEPVAPAADPEPVEYVDAEETPDDPFYGSAGETIRGVPHVLTADNFREIRGQSVRAVFDALVVCMQITAGMMAVAAQIGGEEAEKEIQRPRFVGTQNTMHRNNDVLVSMHKDKVALLKLFDQGEEFEQSMTDSKKSGKGGANHG
jgi:transcriptional regulator with XRE-family HTH domain